MYAMHIDKKGEVVFASKWGPKTRSGLFLAHEKSQRHEKLIQRNEFLRRSFLYLLLIIQNFENWDFLIFKFYQNLSFLGRSKR